MNSQLGQPLNQLPRPIRFGQGDSELNPGRRLATDRRACRGLAFALVPLDRGNDPLRLMSLAIK